MVPDFAKYSSRTAKRRKRRRSTVQPRQSPHSELIVGQQTVARKRRFLSSLIIMSSIIVLLITLTLVKTLFHTTVPSSTTQHVHQSQAKQTTSKPKSQANQADNYQFYSTLSHLKLKTDSVQSLESFTQYANRFNYELQVASTRQRQAAERIREKLGVIGLDGHIDQTTGSTDGQTWWRVKLGPYLKINEVEAVEKVLEQNNMDYIRLTHRKKQDPNSASKLSPPAKEAAKATVLDHNKS